MLDLIDKDLKTTILKMYIKLEEDTDRDRKMMFQGHLA